MTSYLCAPVLVQYWFIARDFVDNFHMERLLSLFLYHSSEIKLPQVALNRLKPPGGNSSRLKDVRANCFCASLLRAQIHIPPHTSSGRAKY